MENPCHITIDIKNIPNIQLLENPVIIEDYMEKVCKTFGLTPVGCPNIVKFPKVDVLCEGGITSCQILSESLMSLHTYPEYRTIYIDIFSCKEFDTLSVFEYSKKYFESGFGYMQRIKRIRGECLSP